MKRRQTLLTIHHITQQRFRSCFLPGGNHYRPEEVLLAFLSVGAFPGVAIRTVQIVPELLDLLFRPARQVFLLI